MFTFAHVSDLHLPCDPHLTLRQHFSKRQLSVWSWRKRHAIQSAAVLDALRIELQQAAVDHVVVTGDLTNFALPQEFAAAAAWLRTLAPPERVSLVPGNHDALVAVPARDGLDRWRAWTRLDEGGWPFVHDLGAVVLIGISTAVPTLPLLARGRVGIEQCARLEQCLQRQAGRCRVVLMHHPPVDGIVSPRKALADRAAVRAVLARAGAELVLYGHARDAHVDCVAGPRAPIPCLCVPSSSALPNPHDEGARWHQLTVAEQGDGWTLEVRVRRWSVAAGAFADGDPFTRGLPVNRAQ
ncbi:MAG: metallophosphoesterase [Nevskiaceae bacterium]|nr:MAG: metallophosphoesterase [Nevskiaceae bacterium]TBR72592.1 MAG: metallophosphoesterase [Nevskiaceae bacterium]